MEIAVVKIENTYLSLAYIKKSGAGLRIACIVTLLVALFACAVPPLTLFLAEREYKANSIHLEDPFYRDAATKLGQYRTLVNEQTELNKSEK